MDYPRPPPAHDAMSDLSDLSETPSTTTISTIAVQAGKAKIVLAVLRSNEWIRVRIQQMEPDLMEVGCSLEEARALRREHDELLMKLNMKQKDVTELLAKADDLASQNKPYQEVYGAMAETLGEAWKDLNAQLEYRKMLLDQSIAFHESASRFSERMEDAHTRFISVGPAHDVDTARRLLQQHQEFKKSILEASMSTLQEGQSLLDRIREMGMHADVQNRHATTAACYGIEHLLELLQDRRRTLEELWFARKLKLEQCLQLLLLDREVKKVTDWYTEVGDAYLKETSLGDSLPAAQSIQDHHSHFELQARDIQETVLRLVRTADQLIHSASYDADGVKKRLSVIDTQTERFMVRLDDRRKNLALAVSFFSQALTALSKLDEVEVQLTSTDLPRNSAALAERHAYLSAIIAETTAPALREGRILLERVSKDDPGAAGVSSKVTELQERYTKLEDMCKARYEAGERSFAYNQLQEMFNNLNTWLGRIGQATLSQHRDMGGDHSAARDFLEIHERLLADIKSKRGDVEALEKAAADLVKSGDQEGEAVKSKVESLRGQWHALTTVVESRIKLAQSYVSFHKKAQTLAIKMDALEQYLKIEKLDPAEVSDASISHKEEKYSAIHTMFSEVQGSGKTFIKEATAVSEQDLDTRRAVTVVETVISHFSERKYVITEYYEHWKVHIVTGKEFKVQWHQFIQDARKTIDWVREIEQSLFVPHIAGNLGKTADETIKLQKKVDDFIPTSKKAQAEIENHLKTAEMLSLRGDTRGQKDQIVNELLKVHTRFQARITEYQVLLNMTIKFFKNLNQLDKLIATTEKEFSQAELPSDIMKAELVLREHESNRDKVKELITFSAEEGEQIVVRVRQQDSEAIAKDEVTKVLQMTEERRSVWDQAWEDQHKKLEQNLQVCQFYFDLKQLHNELDELQRQLMSRHGNYGSSLSSVKMTSQAFAQFETNAQTIESKINGFVTTAEMMIRVNHYDSRRIRHEVESVQKKWADFYRLIGEYRAALDRSTKFFEVMDNCEDWVKDSSTFLLQIGRKATECKTSADALELITQLDKYRKAGAISQEERISFMEKIAVVLYGPVGGPQKMLYMNDKNQSIMDSFAKAIAELGILRDNLVKKEHIIAEMTSGVEAPKPKPLVPDFTESLQNAEITEGQKFTFECKLACESVPKIEWFKDKLALTSADYQTEFKDGIAKMTIEETFSEDTAKYTCRATSQQGSAETSALLHVRESHHKVIAPDFSKHLKSLEVPESTMFMFECHVTGIPVPAVSWFKDDVCIDKSADYVLTKINGTCCLKIRKVAKEHGGRYSCKATNNGGEVVSTAKLNIISVKQPVFEAPIPDVTAPEGKCVRMEAIFSGEPTPQIQWLKGESEIPILPSAVFKITVDQGKTALEITEVYPEDQGNYTVVAKNIGGEARTSCLLTIDGMFSASEAENLTDHEPTRPTVTQKLINKEVLEGSRARLDCVVQAHPEPEVIWYHNQRPLKESKDFQLLFEGDRCSLIIREVYLEDSGEYRVVARNQYGQTESSCRLIVEPLSEMSDASVDRSSTEVVPPKFTQLLKDLEGTEGQRMQFECRLIGNPSPIIKWYKDGKEVLSSPDFQIVSHRELHSLTIPEVFKEDMGNFMCKAVNTAGEAKCYASLIVKPSTQSHFVKTRLIESSHVISTQKTTTMTTKQETVSITTKPPEFKKLFGDMRVKAGLSCKFEVIITGNPKPRVKWFFNSEPVVSPDYQVKQFGDSHTLYIPEVFDEDAGRFSVVADNEGGKATCSALLVVVDESAAPTTSASPPTPMQQPQPLAVVEAPMVMPERVAQVAAAPPAPPSAPKPKPQPPPAPSFPTMDLNVDVPLPPKFAQQVQDITAMEGTRVTFQGSVQGKPAPVIRWFKSGHEITGSADFEMKIVDNRISLSIPEVFEEDAGPYECQAKNIAGTASSTAKLVVQAQMVPASFTERLRSHEVKEGDSVRFTVRVAGKPAPNVTWYREGTQIVSSPDFEIIQEGDVHTLYIPECFYEDSGKFSVQATNSAAAVDCTAELIVEAPITIEDSVSPTPPTSRSPSVGLLPRPAPFASGSSREATPPTAQRSAPQPQFHRPLADIVVREGERIVLECTIAPQPEPDRVQWFRNESEIRPSPDYQIAYSHGSCTLTISEVFPEDAGTFTCTITVQGVLNSTYMVLKVELPLPPQAPPMPPQAASPRPVETSPNFQVQLGNLPLQYGQNAYFECTVQGYPPPEILWTRRGHPLVDKTRYKSTYDQYSGTTTLTILNLRDEDEGEYTCTAINTQGEVSTSALLLGPERYAAWLQEQRPHAQATGPAPPRDARRAVVSELEAKLERTQIPRRGRESPSGFYRPMAERMLDVTAGRRLSDAGDVSSSDETFRISMFEKRLMKEIQYREGRVQAPPAADRAAFDESIPLSEAHAPSVEQALKNFQLMEGSDASFVCKMAGNPYPNITWYQNGRQLKPSTRYEMKLTRDGYATLRIRVAFPEDAGHYTCCATNVVGRTITSGELYVEELSKIDDTSYVTPDTLRRMMKSPDRSQIQLEFGTAERPNKGEGGVAEKFYRPVFRKIPMDQESVEGQMVRFDSIVSGRPMPELFWYRDGVRVNDDYLHKIVVNEDGIHSLIFDHVAALDAGQYTCIAKNRGGEDRFVVNLNVKPREAAQAPRFAERLANTTVKEGESIVLTCEATGHPPPMMSWQKDGKIIPHDHAHYRIESVPGRTTLTISSAGMSDNAWFQCSAISVSGTAANRARLIVQEKPKAKEPERKLVIPRRMTPTPTREIKMPVVETVDESPEPVYMIIPVVTPPPCDEQPMSVQVAPQAQAPPPAPAPPPPPPRTRAPKKPDVKAYTPDESEVLNLIRSQHPPPQPLPVQIEIKPQSHTSTRQPGADEADMFDRDAPRPPGFKGQLKSLTNLVEGQSAHFESRLVPIGDPDMQVEWYKDGRKLGASHRFKALYDFGFVALDIAYTYPEDDGTYMCLASNRYGSDQVTAELRCKGKSSVITDTQLPAGHDSVQAIAAMEASIRREQQRGMMKELMNEQEKDDLPPVFDLKPEPVQVEEGETAKFMAKVGGHPRPRLTWWVNGSMIIAGQRFKLRYDGMIHILEVPKAREYDSGVIRVVAKNPFGEAECSTSLAVVAREDWRSRLKQAPKSIVEVEFNRMKPTDLRSIELQSAFMKPKTTVVELRQFERLTQEKLRDYRDEEVQKAFASINLQHAQMVKDKPNAVMSALEPMSYIDRQVHIERAQYMLDILEQQKKDQAVPTIPRAKIERKDPPTFTKPLGPVKVKEGSEAKLEAEFTGFPTPQISWFREGFEIQPSRDFQITCLANKTYLYVPEVFPEDTGMYTCKAHNPYGMAQCRAMLQVSIDQSGKQKDAPPEFKVQMHDITINVAEPATFDCQVTGFPRAEVYWAKNGIRMKDSARWKFIVEEDHYTLLIYEVKESDSGKFECVVTNKMGKATCAARLDVQKLVIKVTKAPPKAAAPPPTSQVPPQLIEPLRDQQVDEGNSTSFQCRIVSTPEPVVQWYYNNTIVKPSKYFLMKSEGGVHTLTMAGAFPEDEGIYKCTARNQAGEVTCIAHLKVHALQSEPEIDSKAEAARFTHPISSVTAPDGKTVRLEAVVAGHPQPQVVWFREGHQIHTSQQYQITQEFNRHMLTVIKSSPQDNGIFTCRATNAAGVSECSAELFVDLTLVSKAAVSMAQAPPPAAPKILKGPSPVREVPVGGTTRLMVQIAASPVPKFTWYKNTTQIQQSQRFKVSYENGVITLVIFDIKPTDAGDYILKASNTLGEVNWKTTLNIQSSEKLIQLPAQTQEVIITTTKRETTTTTTTEVCPTFTKPMKPEVRVAEKGIARLECQVQAYPPPVISWHVNGIEIAPSPKYLITFDGGLSGLSVNECISSDTGVYTCRAVSELGEAVCSTTLYVMESPEPPKFTVDLVDSSAADGAEVTLICTITGKPMPQISWFHNNRCIDKSEDFVITFNKDTGISNCVIVECLPDDEGTFKCVARNSSGTAVTSGKLTIGTAQEPMVVVEAAAEVEAQRQTKVTRKQELEITGENILHAETVTHKEVKVVRKIVKKESGEPPRFPQPIQPQVIKEGEDGQFTATISGAPTPTIEWLKDKQPLQPTDRLIVSYDAAKMTCGLKLIATTQEDVGVYSCRASNTAGRATCTANVVVVPPHAEVTVTEKTVSVKKERVTVVGEQETRVIETSPQFTEAMMPQYTVNEGNTATMECLVASEPEPKIVWYKTGIQIHPSERITIEFDAGLCRLTVKNARPEDSGEYICQAENPLGSATSRTTLIVKSTKTEKVVTRTEQTTSQTTQKTVTETSVVPQAGITAFATPEAAPEVPPQPLTEPCAVIQEVPTGRLEAPRFVMPLNDQQVFDGDRAVLRVMFYGVPKASVTWYFNSQPVKASRDFQIKIDHVRGESTLTIVEVFPEDEGEYMCKAENRLGAAVTHAHLFVKLPSSSSDEEPERVVTKTVIKKAQQKLTQPVMKVIKRGSFSETLQIDHHSKPKEVQLAFGLPRTEPQRAEFFTRRDSVPQGMKLNVTIEPPKIVESKLTLSQMKRQVEAQATKRQTLNIPVHKQRRFSETVAVDVHARKKKSPEKEIKKSFIEFKQLAAIRGMKMEVEIAPQQVQTSRLTILQKRRIEAIQTQRQMLHIQLDGAAPKFTFECASINCMDGEEVTFRCVVSGNPMPEITWYRNDQPVEENPDFQCSYNRKTGECILHIMEVFPQDNGEYQCIAVNPYGTAITSANLKVDVYEYVPDSEEASASQAELSEHEKVMSEDEVEFLEKTSAFIAKMEKLRQEIQEDHVEEVEVEMTEEFTEETVQMADVKWQIPSATITQMEIAPDEIYEEIMEDVETQQTKEEETMVELRRTSVQQGTESRALTQVQDLAVEMTQDFTDSVEPSSGDVQEVKVDMSQNVTEAARESLVQTQEEHLTEETIIDILDRMPSPVAPTEEEVVKMYEQHQVDAAKLAHVDYTEERHSEEEEEDIFFEAAEPEIPGEEVVVTLATHIVGDKAENLAPTLEARLSLGDTEDANADFEVTETKPEQVVVVLEKAEKKERRLSMASVQEKVTIPQVTDQLELEDNTQETTQQSNVEVNLEYCGIKSPTQSRVGTYEELIDVDTTKDDVKGYDEEIPMEEDVVVMLATGAQTDKPDLQIDPVIECHSPEGVIEEYCANVKEIIMIPAIVRPEYEPSVIELYRLETRVGPSSGPKAETTSVQQDHFLEETEVAPTEEAVSLRQAQKDTKRFQTREQKVELSVEAAAEENLEFSIEKVSPEVARKQIPLQEAMKTEQVVHSAQEVTYEQEVMTEYISEEIQVIRKPSVPPKEVTLTPKVSAQSLMAPVFELPLSDVTVTDGEKAYLECRVKGVPRPTVTWHVEGRIIQESQDIQMTYDDEICTLYIGDVLPDDEGEYTVKAVNEAGTCVTTAYMTVLPASQPESPIQEKIVAEDIKPVEQKPVMSPPKFTEDLQNKEMFESMPVTLECYVVGKPQPTITWFKSSKKITSTEHTVIEYTEGRCTLTITKATLEDEAEYMCEARNKAGVATTRAELLVESKHKMYNSGRVVFPHVNLDQFICVAPCC